MMKINIMSVYCIPWIYNDEFILNEAYICEYK